MAKTLLRTLPLLLSILFALTSQQSSAQIAEVETTRPLHNLLNPDGTLNLSTGFNGSLDARGYTMTTNADGSPRFLPSAKGDEGGNAGLFELAPGDDGWDDRFGPPGVNGTVYAVAVSGSDVYVAGKFSSAGRLLANNVVRWDNTSRTWSLMGYEQANGVGGAAYAIAVSGDDVYVGGIFESAGTVPVSAIARWHKPTNTWHALGGQVRRIHATLDQRAGDVFAIAVVGDDVYVGGGFKIPTPHLAVWNRSTGAWRAIGVPNGTVRGLAVQGNNLYVGGHFDSIDTREVNYIARYDVAAGTWSDLGGGVDSTVFTVAVDAGNVYAGGKFQTAGGVSASNIARWNGTAWSQLGGGVDDHVQTILVAGGELYIGGLFSIAGSVGANCVARWNGAAWFPLNIGVGVGVNAITAWRPFNDPLRNFARFEIEIQTLYQPHVAALGMVGGELIVGGHFSTTGSLTTHNIASWNGTEWNLVMDRAPASRNLNGLGAAVYAVAISGDDVYVGGDFTRAGDLEANYVAQWSTATSTWSALGRGIGGSSPFVRAIAVRGSDVYVGGFFERAGETSASGIARWDGSRWTALGSGVGGDNPYVFAIAFDGSDVYVGGAFTQAGGAPANRVARWSGGTWSALGAGIAGEGGEYVYITSLAANGGTVYAGGEFSRAGDVRAARLARWDGASWSEFGGANATVSTIAIDGANIYVGGDFTQIGSLPAQHIARWNGSAWSALGPGLNGTIHTILPVTGGVLYVGGEFTRRAGADSTNSLRRIARWDGTAWTMLGPDSVNGTNGPIQGLALKGSSIFAGGAFSVAGGLSANNIAEWDMTSWSSLGSDPVSGLNGQVLALVVHGGDVYVGGAFRAVGGMRVNHVARWDGERWAQLGRGLDGPVRAMLVGPGNDLYVGGEFAKAGDQPAAGIARWDGRQWHAVGGGVGGSSPYVFALALNGSDLYVGGSFSVVDGRTMYRIARWSTTTNTWSALGDGVGGSSFYTFVTALAPTGNGVYVGGVFPTVGGIVANNVARWDGTGWHPLGDGVLGAVYALGVNASNHLYVGGDFTMAGELTVANIARWDGSAWSRLGNGLTGAVRAISAGAEEIYVGGDFTASGGETRLQHIAGWNGSKWFGFGSGIQNDFGEGRVLAVAHQGKQIQVGGDFTIAGGKPSYFFGVWDRRSVSVDEDRHASDDISTMAFGESRPNPASAHTMLRYHLDHPGHLLLEVCNLRGEVVRTLRNETVAAGEHDLSWNTAGLESGFYLYRLRMGEQVSTKAFLIQQ